MKRPKLSALIDPTVSKKIRKRGPFSNKKKKIPKHWLPYVVEGKRLTDKIIHLQRKVRRMKMKTQKALSKMKTKEKKASCIIKSARNFKPIAKEIFQNELKNACAKKQSYDYSSSIKNFALKVSFHSNGAYEELRMGFTLPSSRTLRRYLHPVACDPGFLTGVLTTIQENIKAKKYGARCVLLLDETSLKKNKGYDPQLKNYIGKCTILNPEEEEVMASQLLVFMLVSLDGLWRQPIGYWFTNHENADNLSNLLDEALRLTFEFEIDVRAVIFDGAATNISMCNKMGANLSIDNLKNWFPHPASPQRKVYVILGACHMLKLVRNLLGDKEEIFLDGFEHPAKFGHFKALVEHQEEIGFRSGNRLTWEHINYQNHKMKVLLATQLLSGSSATSMEDAQIDGFDPRLNDCSTTIYFARMIDKLFDFCKSRSPTATGQRAALTPENYEEKKVQMMEIINVLEGIVVKEVQSDKKNKKEIISHINCSERIEKELCTWV